MREKMEEGEEVNDDVEILEPYELSFSDLKILSSSNTSPSSSRDIERLGSISRRVLENLGPTGPGLITIREVPRANRLRKNLLPFARRFALLNVEDRKQILKEHSLGSDVPLKDLDRIVSSFAMQLKYVHGGDKSDGVERHSSIENSTDIEPCEFENLNNNFKELGFCMMELGLCLAQLCDRVLGGPNLEQSLLESCTAKGRLIHYHSSSDNLFLKENAKRRQTNKKPTHSNGNGVSSIGNDSKQWQQWHYDYGIFTVLTSPMFLVSGKECPSPSGHTYLKIYNQSNNRVQIVKTNPESFVVQVGEAAEILTKGKLRANLHSVSRPENIEGLSRETFVVFLQPAWSKTFELSDYSAERTQSDTEHSALSAEGSCSGDPEPSKLGRDLHRIVPTLASRLRDGMTFAEFSQETTKRYYGGSGLQAKRSQYVFRYL